MKEELVLTNKKKGNGYGSLSSSCIYWHSVHPVLAVLPYPQREALAENERPTLSVL